MATAAKKVFLASQGVSLMRLMFAHYDKFDPVVGRRTILLGGGYEGESEAAEVSIEILGSDFILRDAPCPLRPTVQMKSGSWWIRGRLLTGEQVEGYFNPHLRSAILGIERR